LTTERALAAIALLAVASGLGGCSSSAAQPVDDLAGCPAPTDVAPDDVFCIGLYRAKSANLYSADALPYTPGVALWSDGAEKQRYLKLPAGTSIDTSAWDAWQFPVETKVFKEFRFDGKLVETRMLWKQSSSNWVMATYVWDDAEKSAPLNISKKPVLTPSGYEIPTAKDCGKCHHGGSDKVLGVEAVALALPSARGTTLETLASRGLLSDPSAGTSISLPEDDSGKAAAALGFLHANCGMACHSARGLGEETKLVLRLRAEEFWSDKGEPLTEPVEMTDAYTAGVGADPTTAAVAQQFPDAKRITPGAHDLSLLWLLAHRRDKYQMPPLVSHEVDETDSQALADWIDALK
jgi:hypothetical protein